MGLGQGELDTETKNTRFSAAGPWEEEGTLNYGAYKSDQAYLERKAGGAGSARREWSSGLITCSGGQLVENPQNSPLARLCSPSPVCKRVVNSWGCFGAGPIQMRTPGLWLG